MNGLEEWRLYGAYFKHALAELLPLPPSLRRKPQQQACHNSGGPRPSNGSSSSSSSSSSSANAHAPAGAATEAAPPPSPPQPGATAHALKRIPVDGCDGLHMWVLSEVDARLEAQQLRPERQVYYGEASGGLVQLQPGGTVVDVGANVGAFSRLAAEAVGAQGRVLAIEPIPVLYEALRRNAQEHAAWCAARGTSAARVEAVWAGVVAEAGGAGAAADFTLFPRCAALSCLVEARDDADALQATQSIVRHDPAAPVSALQGLARSLARSLPSVYAPAHTAVFRALYLRGATTVACPVATLGSLLEERRIERVDLLKINVERGEMGVLKSLTPRQWQRVQQVAMQLHDRGGALDAALALLGPGGPAGFGHVRTHKEPRFVGCCLVQVYAARQPAPG